MIKQVKYNRPLGDKIMSDTKHTKEPWVVREKFDSSGCGYDGWGIEDVVAPMNHKEADMRRAVACVNALADLNPEAIPDAIEWIQDKSRESCQCRGMERGWCDHCVATDILARLKAK